jgi:levanase
VQRAPLAARNGRVRLHVLVDWSSVEVFTDRGRVTITDQIFPDPSSDGLAVFASGGTARLQSLHIWHLRSAWTSHRAE